MDRWVDGRMDAQADSGAPSPQWGQSAAACSMLGCFCLVRGPGPRSPPVWSHSLSESVSYCEHSSGLGSSSQAWWGPARAPLPAARPGGGGEAMTPACSRIIRGL